MKFKKMKSAKNKKYKFIFISTLCAIIPFLVIPPIAIVVSKNINNSKNDINGNDTNSDKIPTNYQKLKFNLGDKMQKNIQQYFSISYYSAEYINSLSEKNRKELFSSYFDGVTLNNWDDIFEEFKILEFNKTSENFIEKNSLKIFAKTRMGYCFSDGTTETNIYLNWQFNNTFNLTINQDYIVQKIKEISIKEEYFDDQFSALNTLEKKFEFFNEIFRNDFSDFLKFKEAVSIFEITSNNNGDPWLNSIRLQFKFKNNYKFSNGQNIKIDQTIEWGYTPNISKVVFRHVGNVESGNTQTLRALVGGLTTDKRITFKWYRDGRLISGWNTSEITFYSAFNSSALVDYEGSSFDELVNLMTNVYTVDVFYNGKQFIDHIKDANKIEEFKIIGKPNRKASFNINDISITQEAFLRAPNFAITNLDKDGINVNGGCLDKYRLGLKYQFSITQLYVFKLAKTKALTFEIVTPKQKINLWPHLYEDSYNRMFLESATDYPMCNLFNKGDCYPTLKLSQNYDLDIDKLVDLDLVNTTKILHTFKF